MTITEWPANERPREKLLLHGAQTLSDAELLAIFFRTGIKSKTAVDLARELLAKLGGIRSLLDVDLDDFCQFQGLGSTKYATLQAALEISRRYLQETIKREDVIKNPNDMKSYLSFRLRNCQREVFAALFLNNQHQVICYEELFQGSINKAAIYPRELIKRVLVHNASAIILAHNHTSGAPYPSEEDKNVTKKLSCILHMIDVDLLDHIIVGEGAFISFAEEGMIKSH